MPRDLLFPLVPSAVEGRDRDWSVGIIVDNFAGGGGASTGIEAATRRTVDVAVNHDPEAIAMHIANHPGTRHHCQSIWSIDPLDAVTIDGVAQPVWLAWFSPDCTHHSNARGGKPREKNIRDLAWVVIHWIDRLGPALRPAQICIENVREFLGWGPLDEAGHRIKEREGEIFDHFIALFRNRSYAVQWKEVAACDHGAPTIRKRLVIKARCDGKPIEWAEPTHGPGRAKPFRTAAECIDWSLPCPSIFLTKEEGRAIGVKRPLAEATMRRIARGVMRYVVDAAEPFIVPNNTNNRPQSIHDPLPTITTGNRNLLIVPTLINTRNGEREGQAPRVRAIDDPYFTVTAKGSQGALVAAFLAQHNTMPNGGVHPGHSPDEPLSTVTTKGCQQSVVAAWLTKYHGQSAGASIDEPTPTVTANSFIKRPGGNPPLALAAAHLLSLKGTDRRDMPADGPAPTITAGGFHVAEVRAFLIKYYGAEAEGHDLDAPMGTVTTKDRFGLVIVTIGGIDYAIVDIGMRMLTPLELAAAQGFPPGYVLDPIVDGKPLTKTAQVRMIGNSVSPPMAEAEVAAMIGRREAEARAA
jgi:DNA (cytosine-5)-methyltransferase 1